MTGVRLVCVLAWVFFLSTAPVAADVVTFWNNVTQPLSASRAAPGILDFAMVHLAMHDAIQAYEGRFRTYAYQPTTPPRDRRLLPQPPPRMRSSSLDFPPRPRRSTKPSMITSPTTDLTAMPAW